MRNELAAGMKRTAGPGATHARWLTAATLAGSLWMLCSSAQAQRPPAVVRGHIIGALGETRSRGENQVALAGARSLQ
jgi:hypothetical protein